MKISYHLFYGPTDWEFVQRHVPMQRMEDTTGLMAINDDSNEIMGCLMVDNFLRNSVHGTLIIANSQVLRHGFFDECFDWVFNQLEKRYIYALVHEENTKALRLNKRLGFEEMARLNEGYAEGIDYILMKLSRENYETNMGKK